MEKLLFVWLLVLLPGCFPDDFLEGFGGPTPLSEFEASILSAECFRESFCATGGDGVGAHLAAHEADCLAARAQLPVRRQLHSLVVAAEQGLVSYDGKAAWGCAFTLSVACDDRLAGADGALRCSQVFRGSAAEGEPCLLHEQCASGSCEGLDATGAVCAVGQCAATTPTAALGESCAERPCVGTDSLSMYCSEALLCEELKGEDEACSGTEQCRLGLWCSNGTCVPTTAVGSPCPCSSRWQRCDQQTNRCVTFGEAGDGCATSECREYVQCAADTLSCTEPPGVGSACLLTKAGELVCSGDAYCDEGDTQPTCAARLPIGRPCDDDGQCVTGHCDWYSCSCQDIASCFAQPPQPGPRICPVSAGN